MVPSLQRLGLLLAELQELATVGQGTGITLKRHSEGPWDAEVQVGKGEGGGVKVQQRASAQREGCSEEVGGPYALSLHLPSHWISSVLGLCGYFLSAIKKELLVFSGQMYRNLYLQYCLLSFKIRLFIPTE